MKLQVTNLAKIKARKALKLRASLPKSKQFGIDKSEAKKLGIASGVERAKQISRSKYIPYNDAVKIAKFKRFSNQKNISPKEQGAIDLWGGKDFINKADIFVKANKHSRGYIRTI